MFSKEGGMRKIAAIVSLILVAAGVAPARADEAETRESINKAATALDQAFARQDKAAKQLMTPDHLAVTPYYRGPQNISDQSDSLRELKYEQTILGEGVPVMLLGPDAAMRIFAAELKGGFKGQKLPALVYVSEIWVKDDGAWREKFYQATTLRP
jgi:hypothetical protein